jgi:uncharacterized protein YfaS (alpha-2-macroglobulin family)
MNYIHIKDYRASGLEPAGNLSQYKHSGKLWYYFTIKDAAVHFFITNLPKGKYLLEYKLIAVDKGNFANGISSIECMYAPEYKANTKSDRINIK